jgi:hypothetical protein
MAGLGEEVADGGLLDNTASVHHEDLVRDLRDTRQVVSDEKVGDPQVALHLSQQMQDLHPDTHIKRAHGFVK